MYYTIIIFLISMYYTIMVLHPLNVLYYYVISLVNDGYEIHSL